MSLTNILMKNTFGKHERLCNKRRIGEVYASPCRITVFPLGVRWKLYDAATLPCAVQVVIVAPKRKLHHAVDRNRAKRLMRECWRQRKGVLLEMMERQGKTLAISISYLDSTVCDYRQMEQRMDKLVAKLAAHLADDERGGER